MPPFLRSRYTFSEAVTTAEDQLRITEREPYRYRTFQDHRLHTVQDGESLFNLAGRYFASLERPAGLWWVIADFQPSPILDPTLVLTPGRVIVIPSIAVTLSLILGEASRGQA